MLTLTAAAAAPAATQAAGGILAAIGTGAILLGLFAVLALFAVGWFWFCKEFPLLGLMIIIMDLFSM